MHTIDYAIVFIYLIGLLVVGLMFQRRASQNIEGFFLGNRKIPWWALGASGMASNLDVSGTMIIAALIYALGFQGFYIEIRGGVVLIMAFLMVFMGKWLRRSQVMTVAEWMSFRFGDERQGRSARVLAAIANLIFAIASVTYFAQGLGIFAGKLLGISPVLATYVMIGLATIYTIASGLYGVVYTDVFQGILIFIAVIYVIGMTFVNYSLPESFEVSVPLIGGGFETIRHQLSEWATWRPRWRIDVPGAYSQYNWLGMAFMFYLLKSSIEGLSGAGGYMVQRYLSSASDREAGLLSLFWTLLLSFRWPFVVSIAILGVSFGASNAVISNPEEVLPTVIMELMPIGFKGLLVAGLVAAAMSTFDSTVNAGAAYWVKDIYQYFLNPKASEKQLIRQGRIASLLVVLVGVAFTFAFVSINDVWGWLTMGLSAGLMIPQLIRWYWWRFNGYGFAGGTLIGMVLAIVQQILFPDLSEMFNFVIISSLTLVSCIVITLVTEPTDDAVLANYYRVTRPFGFWRRLKGLIPEAEERSIRQENRRDLRALAVAVPWQLALFLTPMVLVAKQWHLLWPLALLLAVLSVLLYFTWYRHLSTDPPEAVRLRDR